MHECRARALDLPFTQIEWQFFGAVLALNLALDTAAMWVEHWFITLSRGGAIPTNWMEAFTLACLFSQLVILGIWASLFQGSNLLRVLLSTLVVCARFYLLTWLAQTVAPAVIEFRDWTGFQGLLMIVIIFYTVQILFWILRFMFGWRIVAGTSEPSANLKRYRYTVFHVLGWMAFLSVPLGLGHVYHGRRASDAALLVGCLAVVSWLYGVPYLWATLRSKRLIWAFVLCIPASITATILGWQLYMLIYPQSPAAMVLQAFMFVQGGAALVGLGSGIAARLFGYRIVAYSRVSLAQFMLR